MMNRRLPDDRSQRDVRHAYFAIEFFHKERGETESGEVEEWWECPVCGVGNRLRTIKERRGTPNPLICATCGLEMIRWSLITERDINYRTKDPLPSRLSFLMDNDE